MTSYLDVISLETAKLYLKIDEGQTETDNEITGMINSALSYIEKRTNHIFKTRDKLYYKDCALVSEIDEYVGGFGFKRIDTHMTKHKWGDAFYGRV